MGRLLEDDSGQLILIACLFVVLTIILITSYEYSTLGTGEKSINRENTGSTYFYMNMMNRYNETYHNINYWNFSSTKNLAYFENDMKELALLHGYSLDFVRNGTTTRVIFVDKDVRIEEELTLP